jgi:hypothetical protein
MIDALQRAPGTAALPAPVDVRDATAVAPGGGPTEGMATTIQPLAATEVMPRPAGTTGRSRALVIFGALCLVGLAGIAIAARDKPSGSDLVEATDGSNVTTEVALTTPATAEVTTTIAPSTTVAVTEPPTTPPGVPDLVPGFPVPADLATFLAQLGADPTLIGAHGGEIEDDLRHLLDEKSPRKQGDQAGKLIDHLDTWLDDGSLDPAVAAFIITHLDPIAGDVPGDDDQD